MQTLHRDANELGKLIIYQVSFSKKCVYFSFTKAKPLNIWEILIKLSDFSSPLEEEN